MDTTELLNAIAGLEKNLENIDSAREQVNRTIRAYDGVYGQIDKYTKSLGEVSSNIGDIIEIIKSRRQILNSELDEELKGKFVAMDKKITEFKTLTDDLSAQFKMQLSETEESFNGNCANIQTVFINTINKVLTDFKEDINIENNKLHKFTQKLNEILPSFTKSHSEIEKKIGAYNSSLKNELGIIKAQNKSMLQTVTKTKNFCVVLTGIVIITLLLNIGILLIK